MGLEAPGFFGIARASQAKWGKPSGGARSQHSPALGTSSTSPEQRGEASAPHHIHLLSRNVFLFWRPKEGFFSSSLTTK